jgi:predicted GIY-YIG superfamily endonuclease
MSFYVYILRCRDNTYYCGHTDNMDIRMDQHAQGQIGYTAKRKPVELLWQTEFASRDEALAVELQLKGWSRAKKEALMRNDWKTIQQRAKNRKGASTSSARTGGVSTPENNALNTADSSSCSTGSRSR